VATRLRPPSWSAATKFQGALATELRLAAGVGPSWKATEETLTKYSVQYYFSVSVRQRLKHCKLTMSQGSERPALQEVSNLLQPDSTSNVVPPLQE